MKRHKSLLLKGLMVVGLIVGISILMRGAGDQFLPRTYDVAVPTSKKFAKISKWFPANSEFNITVDVQKALANPVLRDRLGPLVNSKEGIIAELISSLVSKQDAVGMLMLTGRLGGEGMSPVFAVIAQGGFDERTLIPAVRTVLAAGKSGLVAEQLGKYALYAESDVKDPFGFIILDSEHIAVGSRDSLKTLFSVPPANANGATLNESVIFGELVFGPRLKNLLPQGVSAISKINFQSEDGRTLLASVPLSGVKEVSDLRMFLEGVRSLLLLQEEGNAALARVLKGFSIGGDDQGITVSCDIPSLLDLWK